jgi:peptidoglycan hydrolase CwlO-like protein
MSNEKNTKFTAAMTFNTDKVTIQELRDKCNLGEKEMMRVILKVVLNHEPELLDAADEFVAEEKAAIAAAKAQQDAAKAAAKDAAKALRDVERAAAKVVRDQAKAQQAAAKAAAKAQKEVAKAEQLASKANVEVIVEQEEEQHLVAA